MESSCPKRNEDQYPFKINIILNLKDDLFYISKKGSLSTHCGHIRLMIVFTIPMSHPILLPKHRIPGFQTGASTQKAA
jgi:hypothetical protein